MSREYFLRVGMSLGLGVCLGLGGCHSSEPATDEPTSDSQIAGAQGRAPLASPTPTRTNVAVPATVAIPVPPMPTVAKPNKAVASTHENPVADETLPPRQQIAQWSDDIRNASSVSQLDALSNKMNALWLQSDAQARDLNEQGRAMDAQFGPEKVKAALDELDAALDLKGQALRDQSGNSQTYLAGCENRLQAANSYASQITR